MRTDPHGARQEHVFDKPIPLNYGSIGRPPGEYHLRHSLEEFANILESPYPPFDVFFIETTNNNSNYIISYDNGDVGIIYDDNGDNEGIPSCTTAIV
jgi:hypothetical protein